MSLFKFSEFVPNIGKDVFIAPDATILGQVELSDHSNIWFGSVLRGDINKIVIGENTNIQDMSILHVTEELPVIVGDNVTVGHKVILHSCTIGNSTLVGMGSTVLDGAIIGNNCLVAAGSLVTPGKKFPDGSLIKGSPAKVARQLNDKELDIYSNHYKSYIKLKNLYLNKEIFSEV